MRPRRLFCLTLVAVAVAAPPASPPLQSAVDGTMRGRRGTLLVLDVRTNKILASHDLTTASQHVATPGSTVKTFVLLKLFETGKAKPSDAFVCPHHVRVGSRRIDCTHPQLPGPIDPADALAWSCNAYFADVARRLTPEELHDALAKAGLATLSGLAPDEAPGRLRTATTQEQLQLQALGHWGVVTTPLALAEAFIHLSERRDDPNVRQVWLGLEHSVAFGMANAAHVEKVAIAGKTGTASDGQGGPTHGWFVGLAPADKPEIAVVVYLERGRGTEAAAVAQHIFAAYFQK